MKVSLSIIVMFVLLGMCGCSPTADISGGGGSETTNSITVCVKANEISGVVPSQARVELYWDTFNPLKNTLPDSLKITTDTNGRYVFTSITNGTYNVYSFYDSADVFPRTVFISTIQVPADTLIKDFYSAPSTLQVVFSKDIDVQSPVTLSSVQFFLQGSPFYINQDVRSIDKVNLAVPPGTYSCDLNFNDDLYSTGGIKYEIQDSVNVLDSTGSGNESQVLIHAKKADLQ
ncbi:MAG TPA: hypothetical protein VHO70_13245 [Chitinispirillaceae bacterium]|nr:hypothetical protein [Chitinispirillaceae bacterium]